MFVKNTNFVIYLCLAVLAGFGISFLFTSDGLDSRLLNGDISKASRYNSQQEDPETTVIEEKLQNDESFYNSTKSAIELLKTRVDELAVISEQTMKVCKDIPELQSSLVGIRSLSAKAGNTGNALATASKALDKIAAGKNAPEYEVASSNAFVGCQKIERQMPVGKAFVEEATNFLIGRNAEEYAPVASLVATWSVYCAEDAVLYENVEEAKYWQEKFSELSAGTKALGESLEGTCIKSFGEVLEAADNFLKSNNDFLKAGGVLRNDAAELSDRIKNSVNEITTYTGIKNDLGQMEINGIKNDLEQVRVNGIKNDLEQMGGAGIIKNDLEQIGVNGVKNDLEQIGVNGVKNNIGEIPNAIGRILF